MWSHVDLVGSPVGAAEIQPHIESTRKALAQPAANFLVVDVNKIGFDGCNAAHSVHQQVASYDHNVDY